MSTTLVRVPRRDAVDNRAALLAAARIVFADNPDASLDAVAAEAGLSRRSVYGHFASREELQRELVTLGAERVTLALESVTHPDPVIRLALIGAGLWAEVANMRLMTLFAVRGPLAQYTAAGLTPLRARVLDAVREAAHNHGARTDITPERLSRLVEAAALAVLEESTRSALTATEGRRLVMLNVFAALGLGWRESGELIARTPELQQQKDPS
jgi:AcrR family transcriptional regulator